MSFLKYAYREGALIAVKEAGNPIAFIQDVLNNRKVLKDNPGAQKLYDEARDWSQAAEQRSLNLRGDVDARYAEQIKRESSLSHLDDDADYARVLQEMEDATPGVRKAVKDRDHSTDQLNAVLLETISSRHRAEAAQAAQEGLSQAKDTMVRGAKGLGAGGLVLGAGGAGAHHAIKESSPRWLVGGVNPSRGGTIASGLGGALAGGAAAPVVAGDEWESDSSLGKAMRVLQGVGLGATAGITGHDRFGALGGLGGAASGIGLAAGLDKIKPEDDGSDLNFSGRALSEGAKSSLTASMALSSLLRGGGGRGLAEGAFKSMGGGAHRLLRGLIDKQAPARKAGDALNVGGSPGFDFLSADDAVMAAMRRDAPQEEMIELLKNQKPFYENLPPEMAAKLKPVSDEMRQKFQKDLARADDFSYEDAQDAVRQRLKAQASDLGDMRFNPTAKHIPDSETQHLYGEDRRGLYQALAAGDTAKADEYMALMSGRHPEVQFPELDAWDNPSARQTMNEYLKRLPEADQPAALKELQALADDKAGGLLGGMAMKPFDTGGLAGLISHLRDKPVGPVGKTFDYMFGSPNVAKAVDEADAIYKVPAKKYFGATAKDILGGSAAGAGFIPLAVGSRMLDRARGIDPATGALVPEWKQDLNELLGR